MIVHHNYLNKKDFKVLKDYLESETLNWFWNHWSTTKDAPWVPQFTHTFFREHLKTGNFDPLMPLFDKLKPTCLIRVKANLNFKSEKIIETGLHNDFDDKRFMSSTFFINTNDGYFRTEEEKCVSTENTLVTIPSNILHTGTTCTNAPRRIVLNMVYLP